MQSLALSVHEPALRTASTPAPGGRIGAGPEAFQVDEIPLYAAAGEGEHWYVRIRKRLLTTREAIAAIARAASVPEREIGVAGMKDKHAITTQWISVPARTALAPEAWIVPEGLEVLEVTRHTNKLRTGHLRANRFRIELVDVGAPERARNVADELRRIGLANYFGAQRFGRHGSNLVRAVEWIRRGGKASRFHRKLWSSVLQAEAFNRYATSRLALGADRLVTGEVVRLEGSRSLFVVDDPERDRPRLRERDIVLTGPMFGPKARSASGEALAMERRAAGFLSDEDVDRLARHADGTRRDLLVWPEDLRIEPTGAETLSLTFVLPSGSYATGLVREFTRSAFLEESADDTTRKEE